MDAGPIKGGPKQPHNPRPSKNQRFRVHKLEIKSFQVIQETETTIVFRNSRGDQFTQDKHSEEFKWFPDRPSALKFLIQELNADLINHKRQLELIVKQIETLNRKYGSGEVVPAEPRKS